MISFLASKLDMNFVAGIRYLCNLGTQLQPQRFEHEDEFLLVKMRMNTNKNPFKKLQLQILAP